MMPQSTSENSRIGVVRQSSSGRDSNNNHHHNTNDTNDSDTTNNNNNNNQFNHDIDNNDDDENDANDEYLVSCRCESAKVISTLLSCLRHVTSSDSTGGSMGNNTIGNNNSKINNSSIISSTQNNGNSSSYSVRSRRSRSTSTSNNTSSLQPVTVYCSPTNITFHIVGASKQIQASVDMPSKLFSDYSVATTETNDHNIHDNTTTGSTSSSGAGGEFCINLATLLDCLHCLGTHNLDTTKICFSYNTTQEIFKLELLEESSGILSTASIPGMLSPDSYDCIYDGQRLYTLAHAFRQSEKYVRIILQSESLYELITELDYVAGGTMANVTLKDNEFVISVTGFLGECQIVLPTCGDHIISIEVPEMDNIGTNTTTAVLQPHVPNWTYPLHALLESMRGLEIADETCITINMAGMMAIQHQVIQLDSTTMNNNNNSDTSSPSFVDFILCCMVDEENDEEENDDSPMHVENDASTATQQTIPTSRARIVSQTKQPYLHHNTNDSDEDDDENDSSTSRRSHIAPMGASGARLFGSLAMSADMDDDDDDDDNESPKVHSTVAAMTASDKHHVVVEDTGRHRRRRPRNIVEESSNTVTAMVRRPEEPKKSRTVPTNKAPVVATRTRTRTKKYGGNEAARKRKQYDFNNSDSNDDGDDDDDMEVSMALSGHLASSISSSRNRRPNNNMNRSRRTINDDDDDDGSSSPELVYGPQH